MGDKASWEDDKAVLHFFESEGAAINEKLGEARHPRISLHFAPVHDFMSCRATSRHVTQVRKESVKKTVAALLSSLPEADKSELLASL